MRKHYLFFPFLLFFFFHSQAQLNYTNRWYFGINAGLDFSSGSPVSITGPTQVDEGTATICDAQGNVVFYSDGTQIWNRNNQVMPNGSGIMGGAGSSQQAPLIIKSLSSPTQYYLFTIGDHVANVNQFRYTIVDMCLNGGLGDVITSQKNVLIGTGYTERLVAVRKPNSNDLWLITNKMNSNQWNVFSFTAAGINMTPLVSNVGPQCGNQIGWLKINHAGTKLAHCTTFNPCRALILFDFDKATGAISNPVTLNSANDFYGAEFSPNDSILYTTDVWYDNYIFQYDVNTGASYTVEFQPSSINGYYQYGAIQLASDGKIYTANNDSTFIGCISNPDVFGAGCNYVKHAVNLQPGTRCRFGLNVAYQSYILDPDSLSDKFSDSLSCNIAAFTAQLTSTYDSVKWNFGEPSSGNNNIASGNFVSHAYASTGNYQVAMILYASCKTDTIIKQVTVSSLGGISPIQLGVDTNYCGVFTRTLIASDAGTIWNTGVVASQINVNTAGTYWASFTNSCGTVSDTIRLVQGTIPVVNLGNDTSLCNSQALLLNAANVNSTYHWQDNSSNSTYQVSSAGNYSVTVTHSDGCQSTDAISVSTSNLFLTIATTNTSCGNTNGMVVVNVLTGTSPFTYLWNNAAIDDTLSNIAAGIYSVTVHDAVGCSSTAGAQVNSSGAGSVNVQADKSIMCSGDSAYICASGSFASYLWNTGQTGQCIYSKLAGNYYVTATDFGNCTATSNHVALAVYPLPPVSISVNGDTLTGYNAVTYQWLLNGNPILNATASVYIANQTGDYSLAVTDSNGCRATSTVINIIKTGIHDLEEEEITVFPNPNSTGSWKLTVGRNTIGRVVEIFDVNGKLVFNSPLATHNLQIDLNVSCGIYLLRITSPQRIFIRKLIRL